MFILPFHMFYGTSSRTHPHLAAFTTRILKGNIDLTCNKIYEPTVDPQLMKMKNPFIYFREIQTRKLLLLSILIVFVVSIIVFGPLLYKSYQEAKKKTAIERQQSEAKKKKTELESIVSIVKKWPTEKQLSIGAREMRLETKWQSGYLLYKFEVDLTEGLNNIRRNRSSYSGFIVKFLDSDGFKVYSFNIPINSMTDIVDGNGVSTSFSVNEKTSISAEEYLKLESVTIGWDF